VPEPCAGKLARTVLRGRKLPGTPNPEKTFGSGQGVYKEQKISLIE